MKFRLIVIYLLLSVTALRSQEKISLESPSISSRINNPDYFPILNGAIQNFNPEILKDLYIDIFVTVPNAKNQITMNVPVNSDGSFSFTLEDGLPYHQVYLKVGKYYEGYLILNSQLEIFLDFKSLVKSPVIFYGKGVSFSGQDGDLNEYYSKYFEYETKKRRVLTNQKTSQLMNRISQPEYKINQIRNLYEDLEKIEKAFARKHGKTHLWILEDERLSNYYADLLTIYLNHDMNQKVWSECLAHLPKTVTLSTNQYYDIICFLLQNHSARELKSITRTAIYKSLENDEDKSGVNEFLKEVEKKNAGVRFDEELVSNGVENYMSNIDEDVDQAKQLLFVEKLKKIDGQKLGLIVSIGMPMKIGERRAFINLLKNNFTSFWITEKIEFDLKRDSLRFVNIQNDLEKSRRGGENHKLGEKLANLVSGAVLYEGIPDGISDMLARIRNVYPEDALILHIWSMNDINSIEELKNSGLVMDKIESLPVKVVHLCLSENTNTALWRAKLEEVFIKGDHILLDNRLSSEMLNYFDFQQLPHCIYFGPNSDYDPYFINRLQDLQVPNLRNKLN